MATVPEFLKDLKEQMKGVKVKKVNIDFEDISEEQDSELKYIAENIVIEFGKILSAVNSQMISQGIIFKNPKKHLDFAIERTMDVLESVIDEAQNDKSKN